MTTDDYTPSETAERIKREWLATHAGSGFEDLCEAEWDRMIAQVRAEALREAYADLEAYTDSGAPFGHRPVEEFLLHRADRIEREAGLK